MISERPRISRTVRAAVEDLHRRYHHREFVAPDPVQFLYNYPDPRDREIVGLVASSLAYGRVAQILKSVGRILDRMENPRSFVERASAKTFEGAFAGLRHRWTTGDDVAALLKGIKGVIRRHGSLRECFQAGDSADAETVLPALERFTEALAQAAGVDSLALLSSPCGGSACKRLNLFLRWMVRHDELDPGGWEDVGAHRLVVPLDTHIYRIGCALGWTARRQADLRAALEITEALRGLCPEDPVRYDFVLCRLGIRGGVELEAFLRRCGASS